jgi:YVTN family beta-propeller protein
MLFRLAAARWSLILVAIAGVCGCHSLSRSAAQTASHPRGDVSLRSAALPGDPFAVAVSREGQVLVGLQHAERLALLSLKDLDQRTLITVGAVPTDVRFSPLGGIAAVTNQFSRAVGIVDLQRGMQVESIAASSRPYRLLFSRDGARLYVTNDNGVVDVIDVKQRRRVASLPATPAANGLALAPNGRELYVTGTVGRVTVMDLTMNIAARDFAMPCGPQGIAVSPDGAELYVACEMGRSVIVVSSATGRLIERVALTAPAFDLAITPDGTQLYVTQPGAGVVLVLDRVRRATVATHRVGGSPRRIAFSATGDAAVIGNEDGWIDIIR